MAEIQVYASLLKWVRTPRTRFVCNREKRVRNLLQEMAIPEDEVAIVMINGNRGSLDSFIADADFIKVFPLIGGG